MKDSKLDKFIDSIPDGTPYKESIKSHHHPVKVGDKITYANVLTLTLTFECVTGLPSELQTLGKTPLEVFERYKVDHSQLTEDQKAECNQLTIDLIAKVERLQIEQKAGAKEYN